MQLSLEGTRSQCGRSVLRPYEGREYLTATRGFSAPEARICYQRVESLCHSLNHPLLLFTALMGQWLYSLVTDKVTETIRIAQRLHSLAQEQNDPTLMVAAYAALQVPLYFLGDFEAARQSHKTRR